MALIISLYLGAAEGSSRSRKAIAGIAALCPSVRKETLAFLQSNPDVLQQSEGFLKKVLRHYKVTNPTPVVKALLSCRARLYYRVGRLLQSWPDNEYGALKALAKIEANYSTEMVAARAISAGIEVLYAMPEIVQTSIAQERPRKAARTAASSSGDILSASGVAAGSKEEEAIAEDAREVVNPQDISSDMCVVMPSAPLAHHGEELWRRITMQCLLHAFVIQHASVDGVQIMVAQSTEPMVWQARATKTHAEGTLMLIPYAPTLLPPGEIKRPGPGTQSHVSFAPVVSLLRQPHPPTHQHQRLHNHQHDHHNHHQGQHKRKS